jgi:hypothetical protein
MLNQVNTIVQDKPLTINTDLKDHLKAWEANPVGKCGTCLHAQGFDNQFEISKSIKDTCVRCTNRDRAFLIDQSNFQGRKYQEQLRRDGFFRIYRIEAMGRFSCQQWEAKC